MKRWKPKKIKKGLTNNKERKKERNLIILRNYLKRELEMWDAFLWYHRNSDSNLTTQIVDISIFY